MTTVAEMFDLGWVVNGEVWKWRKMLFSWEDDLVRAFVQQLT